MMWLLRRCVIAPAMIALAFVLWSTLPLWSSFRTWVGFVVLV